MIVCDRCHGSNATRNTIISLGNFDNISYGEDLIFTKDLCKDCQSDIKYIIDNWVKPIPTVGNRK